jgi:hypothetical protein
LDPELLRDLLRRDGPVLAYKRRIAGDDEQAGNLRQVGYQVVGDSFCEILLLRLATQIEERQHGDRGLVGQGQRRFRRDSAVSSTVCNGRRR